MYLISDQLVKVRSLGIKLVQSLLLYGSLQLRYEKFCKYTQLIFLDFLLISNVFIRIDEYTNKILFKSAHEVGVLCLSICLISS